MKTNKQPAETSTIATKKRWDPYDDIAVHYYEVTVQHDALEFDFSDQNGAIKSMVKTKESSLVFRCRLDVDRFLSLLFKLADKNSTVRRITVEDLDKKRARLSKKVRCKECKELLEARLASKGEDKKYTCYCCIHDRKYLTSNEGSEEQGTEHDG